MAAGLLRPSVAVAASTASAQDKAWLVAAHQSNLSEIAAGRAAEQKATTSAVRQHRQLFVSDHTRLDGAVTSLAGKLGVALPSQPNAEQRATLSRVSAKSGKAFDDAWVSTQIASHWQSQAAGQLELASGGNGQVIAADQAAAPVVAAHLQMLLSLSTGKSVATGLAAPAGRTSGTAVPWALVIGGVGAVGVGAVGLRRRTATASS